MSVAEFLDRVILDDCLRVMRQLPEDCVDMAFADPHFNLGKHYDSYHDRKWLDEYLRRAWLRDLWRMVQTFDDVFTFAPEELERFRQSLKVIFTNDR